MTRPFVPVGGPRASWRLLLTVLLALPLGGTRLAGATTYVALSPYEVLELADAVLTASVADVTARVEGDDVWTVVTLDVTEWLTDDPDAGEEEAPREELVIEALGGEAEGRRLIVSGSPVWRAGDEVLVALHGQEGLASPVVGFAQGVWRLADDGLVDPEGRYLGVDAGGALVRADGPTAPAQVLDAVRLAIAGERPEPLPRQPQEGAEEPEGSGSEAEEPEGAGQEAAAPESAEPPAAAPARPAAGSAGPAAPSRPVTASYSVDDSGGPLLLSDRVAEAVAAWEGLAGDAVEVTRSDDARHSFAYGDEALFGPETLTLTLAEGGDVRVLVRPDAHPALDAALRHEVGALLGLPLARGGVMSMAVSDATAVPGEAELAELAALASFEPADLDRDGVVGFGDLLELAAAYGRAGVNLPGDLDADGDVDDDDVEALRRGYVFAPPAGAVPGAEGAETEQGEGSEPAQPGEPDEPGEPGDPVEPDEPSEPVEPEEPTEPEEP